MIQKKKKMLIKRVIKFSINELKVEIRSDEFNYILLAGIPGQRKIRWFFSDFESLLKSLAELSFKEKVSKENVKTWKKIAEVCLEMKKEITEIIRPFEEVFKKFKNNAK